jgi:hypothetical protein
MTFSSPHPQHNLADEVSRLKVLRGVLILFEGKDSINDRVQMMAGDEIIHAPEVGP